MQTRSSAVYRQPSPMNRPLFRMLWCDSVPGFEERVPGRRAEEDDVFKFAELRPDFVDHCPVVARLEALGAHEYPHARLPQGKAELVTAVRRVDVDQDDPGLGRCVLQL